jgi:peptidoglycan/LPS O-acetylase OafA/YrhL
VNKSFAAWMMSVGLLLCMVAGVGYLAKPVTLPAPFRIDVLLATGMAAAAFALGALSDRLVEQLGRVRARRRTEARERQRQAEWETSENGAAERVT